MTVNKQPHHGYKTGAPIRTNLGRVLEPAPQATADPRPTPDTIWVCARRLHFTTLPRLTCVECPPPTATGLRVQMERFVKA